jgi:hypothetical protein
MNKTQQTIKEKYNLDDSYELIYIDYNEYFEDAKDVERIVQDGNTDFIYEEGDWWLENRWESINYFIKELEEEHGEISDEDKEEIREYLEENDISDPGKQLMKNTSSGYFYYSLGIEIENHDGHACCEEGCEERIVNNIMKLLKTKNPETKKSVREVVANAGYGGSLVIIFEDSIENLLNQGTVIDFDQTAEICIMDRKQGSGWSAPLNTNITVEFNRQNLHCDEGAPGYSFTKDVCNLTKGFMGKCIIRNKKSKDTIIKLQINETEQYKMQQEKEYERRWKEEGKCTFGDINIKRHKDTYYLNKYPCGTHCPHCGQFWVD